MSINSTNEYAAAPKQPVHYTKTTRAAPGLVPMSLFDLAGQPGAGALAVGNTANGVVPVAGQAGYPVINAFGAGADGHLTRIEWSSTVAGRMWVFDRLFKCGAYAFNADVTLVSQPSYAARLLNFLDLQIWVEQVTAATGNQAVNVFYTNESGVTGRQTGATGIGAAPTLGRCWQLPLQAGDAGVQRIERVVGTVASAGTFNVMVLRQLWHDTVHVGGTGSGGDMLRTGLIRVWPTTALYHLNAPIGTSTGTPLLTLEIANG